jgi:hypothetical protein
VRDGSSPAAQQGQAPSDVVAQCVAEAFIPHAHASHMRSMPAGAARKKPYEQMRIVADAVAAKAAEAVAEFIIETSA